VSQGLRIVRRERKRRRAGFLINRRGDGRESDSEEAA